MEFKRYFEHKNIMITGGVGFIGSNLAHKLVEYGARVTLVDSMIPDHGGNLFNIEGIKDKVKLNIADVRDEHSMDYLVRGHDIIFNLAGQVSHIESMRDPYTDLEINCRSQLSLLEACRKNNPQVKIIYAGTRQVYGKPDYLPVDEKHNTHPTDVNGINMLAGEWYHILYNNVYDIHTVSLRMTNVFGPRQLMLHNKQGFIPWFIRKAIDDEEITIFGNGQQCRDINYVDDVVEAMLLAAIHDEARGKIFNLGHKEMLSLLDFTKLLIEVCQRGRYRLVPFPEDKKRIDIGDYYADFSLIKKTLGWEPKVSVREGLERTVEFYRKYKKYYW